MARVLVVDDDDYVRLVVAGVLTRAGHDVITANNGVQAETLYRRDRPEIVLLDVIMPEREGIETLRSLLQLDGRARVIAMSGGGAGLHQDHLLMMLEKLGAVGTLGKPFDSRELLDAVAAALAA